MVFGNSTDPNLSESVLKTMADLEDGEILDSSEDETKNVPHNTAKNNVN